MFSRSEKEITCTVKAVPAAQPLTSQIAPVSPATTMIFCAEIGMSVVSQDQCQAKTGEMPYIVNDNGGCAPQVQADGFCDSTALLPEQKGENGYLQNKQ